MLHTQLMIKCGNRTCSQMAEPGEGSTTRKQTCPTYWVEVTARKVLDNGEVVKATQVFHADACAAGWLANHVYEDEGPHRHLPDPDSAGAS